MQFVSPALFSAGSVLVWGKTIFFWGGDLFVIPRQKRCNVLYVKEMRSPSPQKAAENINQKPPEESTREFLSEGVKLENGSVADEDVRDDSRQDAGATYTAEGVYLLKTL